MKMKLRLREKLRRWIAVIVIVTLTITLMSGMTITLRAQEKTPDDVLLCDLTCACARTRAHAVCAAKCLGKD